MGTTLEKKPTPGKVAKAVTGCGGCGCLLALVSLCAGGVMLAWGTTDSKVDELVGPGAAVLVLGLVVGFFCLAVLIGGIVALRRAGSARAPDGAPDAPAVSSSPQAGPASGHLPQVPPGVPPPGPPPAW